MNLRNKETGEVKNPHTTMIELKELDKKGYVMLNGHPCKIKGIGSSTVFRCKRPYITGSNIWTNKEQTQFFSMNSEVQVPLVKMTDYSLVGIEDNFASLMDGEGNIREDLRLPSWEEKGDLTEKIINAFEANQNLMVTVMAACGQEMIADLKADL